MDDKEYTAQSNGCMNMLRKRLFILAAYLLVSTALLAYVSYGQFKISVEGTTTLPTAEGFYASISLRENEDAGETVLSSELLAGLQPGDNAMSFSEDTADTNHKLELTVNPWEEVTGEGGTQTQRQASTLGLAYSIRIYSDRSIPLQFVLVDPAVNKKYVSAYDETNGVYKFYNDYNDHTFTYGWNNEVKTGYIEADTASGEAVLGLDVPAGAEGSPQTYRIYVGWDSGEDTDSRYRKEVDILKVGAQIVAKKGDENPAPGLPVLPYPPAETT